MKTNGIVDGVLGALYSAVGGGLGAGVVKAQPGMQYAAGVGASYAGVNQKAQAAKGVINVAAGAGAFGQSAGGRKKYAGMEHPNVNPYSPTDPRFALWEQYGKSGAKQAPFTEQGDKWANDLYTGQKRAPKYKPEPRTKTLPTVGTGDGGGGGETPAPDFGGYGYDGDGFGRGFGDDSGGYSGGYGAADAMTLTWRISA